MMSGHRALSLMLAGSLACCPELMIFERLSAFLICLTIWGAILVIRRVCKSVSIHIGFPGSLWQADRLLAEIKPEEKPIFFWIVLILWSTLGIRGRSDVLQIILKTFEQDVIVSKLRRLYCATSS